MLLLLLLHPLLERMNVVQEPLVVIMQIGLMEMREVPALQVVKVLYVMQLLQRDHRGKEFVWRILA